ncbi:hypothetical protein [Legionella jamestowniensis]|uniref:Uncharacterized protein n=1 Tax=Legionella jamestowniensis TaxID=455 RepID=A0A0W0UHJ6_9GAMM|nr:hypothetical protein [Legionella jamestowniensis]KTD07175.1 hypothetical protein Ljam_1370 [Legionella jamestowniensis]
MTIDHRKHALAHAASRLQILSKAQLGLPDDIQPEDIRFQSLYKLSFRFCSKSSSVSLSTPAAPALVFTNL